MELTAILIVALALFVSNLYCFRYLAVNVHEQRHQRAFEYCGIAAYSNYTVFGLEGTTSGYGEYDSDQVACANSLNFQIESDYDLLPYLVIVVALFSCLEIMIWDAIINRHIGYAGSVV